MKCLPTRRAVLAAGAMTVVGHGAVWEQESNRTYRLGVLAGLPRGAPQSGVVVADLGKAGFIDGKNLIVDWRLQGSPEQTTASVAELVRLAPDVLLAAGTPGMVAAQAATRTIPILGIADDMVASGLVPSLANPGANLTGISILATELDGKRLEILMELVPASRHMAALADPSVAGPAQLAALRSAAASRSVVLSIYPVHGREEIAAIVGAAQAFGATALNVLASRMLDANRKTILDRCAGDLPMARDGRGRRLCRLRSALCQDAPPTRPASRQGAAWRKAGRYPGRAADRVRAGDQSQDGKGARSLDPVYDPRPRRRGHRVMNRRELTLLLCGAMTATRSLRAQQKAMPVVGYLGSE